MSHSTLVLVAVFALAVGAALLVYLVVQALSGSRSRTEAGPDDGPSLIERVAARQPPTDWSGKIDRGFEHMVQGTLLELTSEQALGIMLLAGTVVAVLVFFLTEQWWASGLTFFAGLSLPLLVFLALQARWRRAIQDQLPDGIFLLARSLRAGGAWSNRCRRSPPTARRRWPVCSAGAASR